MGSWYCSGGAGWGLAPSTLDGARLTHLDPPEDLGVMGLHPVGWIAPMEDSSRTSNPTQVTSQSCGHRLL